MRLDGFLLGPESVLSGGESVINNVASGDVINWGAVAKNTGIGALTGILGGAGLQAAAMVMYCRIVSAGGGFGFYQLSYRSSGIAETFAKEFIKGTIKPIGTNISIEAIGNAVYIMVKQ